MTIEISLTNKLAISAFLLTLAIGVLGNLLVCYTFGYKKRHRRSTTETLLFILGIVDLFASITNPTLFTYWILTNYRRWDFGIIGCKLIPLLGPLTSTLSAVIIIIICINRYRAIVTPFKGSFSLKQIFSFVAAAIIFSLVSQIHHVYHLTVSAKYGTCLVPDVADYWFAIPSVIFILSIDLTYIVVFTITNIRIFQTLRGGHIRQLVAKNSDDPEERKREITQITRVLLTVGIVFALLVFPRDAFQLAYTLSWMSPQGIQHTPRLLTMNSWFKVLHVANSCANVFIYSKMHTKFRHQLWVGFIRCINWKQKVAQYTRSRDNSLSTTGVISDLSEFNHAELYGKILKGNASPIDIRKKVSSGNDKVIANSLKQSTIYNPQYMDKTDRNSDLKKTDEYDQVNNKQVRVRFASNIEDSFDEDKAFLLHKMEAMAVNIHEPINEQYAENVIVDECALLRNDTARKGKHEDAILTDNTDSHDFECDRLLVKTSNRNLRETNC